MALARFGGLRTPSESFSLTWGDVDWGRGRVSVPSPKTEHSGKGHRVIPLFPELRPHLEVPFEHAEEGSEFILPEEYRRRAKGERGWGGANLRTQFGKIVRRAGVDPWPRLWHSLRASCESDLAQSFPLATVTKWLGNTPSVALRHYVDPTETAFDKAVSWTPGKSGAESGAESGALGAQNAAQQVAATNSRESHLRQEYAGIARDSAASCDSLPLSALYYTNDQMGCIGIEPTGGVVHTPTGFEDSNQKPPKRLQRRPFSLFYFLWLSPACSSSSRHHFEGSRVPAFLAKASGCGYGVEAIAPLEAQKADHRCTTSLRLHEILALRERGLSYRKIAQELGLSHRRVEHVMIRHLHRSKTT